MANLGQKDGVFHVRFRFRSKEFKKSLKIRDETAALAAKNLVELTVHGVLTGQITVPDGIDTGDFIVSGGTLSEPIRRLEPIPTCVFPSTAQLIDEYKESQKH